MRSGVLLIVVTMFAALGVYYLLELAAGALFRRGKLKNAVVLLAVGSTEEMWSNVLNVRSRLPESSVIVLCEKEMDLVRLEPGLKGVVFASPDTVGDTVCAQLAIFPRKKQDA
ncbi:hypothetical protein [uncultured Ruthenibacterium sp.]|uniref:hypothetical protein n=1 Tax=uncultured Ruthenibacterium sp. TaxID=1905347 RepID=UPI00349EA183